MEKINLSSLIEIIATLLGLGGLGYYIKDRILSFISAIQETFVPLWLTIIAIIITLLFAILYNFLSKRRHRYKSAGFPRSRDGTELEHPYTYNDLKWIAYTPQFFSQDEYVWLTGPFCPNCTLKLEWRDRIIKKLWHCDGCNKDFKPIKKSASEDRAFVQDVIYAEQFRKREFQS